jgi:hypothetical protein
MSPETATLFDWHELALGLIAVLLTILGWMTTYIIKGVVNMRRELSDHLVSDAQAFGALDVKLVQQHSELMDTIGRSGRGDRRHGKRSK